MNSTCILLSEKKWHEDLLTNLKNRFEDVQWIHIKDKKDLTTQYLNQIQPLKVFIPHWSYIIPGEIYNNYECIVFHMTDLPFGKGGSPLQNLIVRGYQETKISALRVQRGLDTGPIYLKQPLSLLGTAQEIFFRANTIIEEMIVRILDDGISPSPQSGTETVFKRRKPQDSNIEDQQTIEQIYDYIRMLDAEGYPKAFIEFGNFRLEFSRANIQSDKSLLADVRIVQK